MPATDLEVANGATTMTAASAFFDTLDPSRPFPTIITCPSEFVALSAALGYAQVTGIPQCVLVHVDCGTLALGQSIHNASVARVPVLCFAGLSPSTQDGEKVGSRTEYIHWLQDVHDQQAIVRQYCRYSGEIRISENIKQVTLRALQFSTSDPKGPCYLVAGREVLEQHIEIPDLQGLSMGPISPTGLPESGVELISHALINAKRPLIITGYSGRNLRVPPLLAKLCDQLPIRVVETVGSDLCIRHDHDAYVGFTVRTHPEVLKADVIIVLDCDVPWIPTAGKPAKDVTTFHLDVDPLKQQMPLFYINAGKRYRVSSELAITQLIHFLNQQNLRQEHHAAAFEERAREARAWRQNLRELEAPPIDGTIRMPFLAARLRHHVPPQTTYVLEAVTNAAGLVDHLGLVEPGSMYGSGAGGLGWGGGAALGAKLAKPGSFVCAVLGDGTFFFAQMDSVYWISRRYDIPFLMVVLNNGGWEAPKVSALLVNDAGLASQVSKKNYPGIAAAAGKAWGRTVTDPKNLDTVLSEAVNVVKGGISALVEVRCVTHCYTLSKLAVVNQISPPFHNADLGEHSQNSIPVAHVPRCACVNRHFVGREVNRK
ncbi:hypothetical protein H2204_011590 [Knufia peltigerae]|uniref:Pyruvate decarboxylase n=1 Tax=Knufia peltigerae TaxID=1002370 RepID=A0AA38XTY8_9EURO|nr:hypothetical protein H2204_011590 [Knufia peltigerae]